MKKYWGVRINILIAGGYLIFLAAQAYFPFMRSGTNILDMISSGYNAAPYAIIHAFIIPSILGCILLVILLSSFVVTKINFFLYASIVTCALLLLGTISGYLTVALPWMSIALVPLLCACYQLWRIKAGDNN